VRFATVVPAQREIWRSRHTVRKSSSGALYNRGAEASTPTLRTASSGYEASSNQAAGMVTQTRFCKLMDTVRPSA